MPKKIASKLDRFAETLVAMESEEPPKTLRAMQVFLEGEGVNVEQSTIGRFLSSLRSAREQEELLQMVATGSQQCQEIDAAFAKNPAPQLETVIRVFKVLIMQLATKGKTSPELLSMSNNLARTAIEFISGQTKAAFKEREIRLAEQKQAETKKDEATKALEYCLEEAKQSPAVQEYFKEAFAALKKFKSGLAR
jgi:DNA-binding phage protein